LGRRGQNESITNAKLLTKQATIENANKDLLIGTKSKQGISYGNYIE